MTTTLVAWHTVTTIPSRAREVVASGDEAQTTPHRRYYVEHSASGWWLYRWESGLGGAPDTIRCRELDGGAQQGSSDALWIAGWQTS